MIRSGRPASVVAAALACAASCAAFAADPPASPYAAGATIFEANCAVCHGAKGLGTPSLAPPLTSNPARYAGIPEGRRQLAMTVLNGMFGAIEVDGKHFDFRMPQFLQLDDAALAAVLNFVVFDLANAPAHTRPLAAPEIAAERAHPVDGAAVREHRALVLAALGS
ncbi:MAG TPA: cytochrome c [Steroidobacteraceae bacterium]|nr:cytochrome c [Steroidobacteraceae bacterium]